MRRLMALAAALAMLAGLTACGEAADPDTAQESVQVIAMDTVMIFRVYGEKGTHAAYAAEDMVRELEAELSRTDGDSLVSQINAADGAPVEIGEDLARLLLAAADYAEATDGAFDITVAPVVSAWGFTTDSQQVPGAAELAALLAAVDASAVRVEQSGGTYTVSLGAGQAIDLGGIAKGYVSDLTADIFAENDIPRATAELGGNVLAWGTRPDGTPWRVGVQDPARPGEAAYVGLLELEDAYAVTSGGYQRYFEQDGQVYHHIIDPATGYPADSGLVSVTVVADCDPDREAGTPGVGTMCDALSTALFVMGEERALDFWRTGGLDFDLVLATEDGRVLVTAGIADVFTPEESSGYVYETVS